MKKYWFCGQVYGRCKRLTSLLFLGQDDCGSFVQTTHDADDFLYEQLYLQSGGFSLQFIISDVTFLQVCWLLQPKTIQSVCISVIKVLKRDLYYGHLDV